MRDSPGRGVRVMYRFVKAFHGIIHCLPSFQRELNIRDFIRTSGSRREITEMTYGFSIDVAANKGTGEINAL